MSLILPKIYNGEIYNFHRATAVRVEPSTLFGEVRLDSYLDKDSWYNGAEPQVSWYSIQWLRNSNYILDSYTHLLSTIFIGATEDLEGEPEEMESTVVMPARPSAQHYIDNGNWVADISLAKQLKLAEIKAARDSEESNGFTAYGKVFDSDSKSLQRVSIGVLAAQTAGSEFSIDWTCADNSVITLNQQQMLALPLIMGLAANAMHVKARDLKAQINAATTLEEVLAVVW